MEADHDFLVIDTPGTDNYLMHLGHSMADTLVTPLHDSLVDVDVLGTADPATFAITEQGRYAAMIAETASAAWSICEKVATIVFFAFGFGMSRRSTFVITPSVPSEPTSSRVRS